MIDKSFGKWGIIFSIIALLSCTIPASKVQNLEGDYITLKTNLTLPQGKEIYDCGPESLCYVLNYYGQKVDPDLILPEVFYEKVKGTHSDIMVPFLRRRGLVAKVIKGSIGALKKSIEEERPAIVLVEVKKGARPHYLVVSGYSDSKEEIVCEYYDKAKLLFKYDDFIELWRPIGFFMLDIHPALYDKDLNAATQLELQGDFRRAIEYFEKVISRDSDCFRALYGLGNCYLALNDLAKAIDFYKKALSIDSDHPRLLCNLAHALIQQKQGLNDALELAEKAVEIMQKQRAKMQVELSKEKDKVIARKKMSLFKDAEDRLAHALGTLGQARVALGKFDHAIATFKASYELIPLHEKERRKKRLVEIAECYERLQNHSEAQNYRAQAEAIQ